MARGRKPGVYGPRGRLKNRIMINISDDALKILTKIKKKNEISIAEVVRQCIEESLNIEIKQQKINFKEIKDEL